MNPTVDELELESVDVAAPNKRIRRYLFDRSPYALIYRANAELIYVLAVMHQSRRPGYWRGR